MGGNGGELGGNGGGGMEKNGRNWGISRHGTRDVGCGGLWRDVVEENGRKMGGKWDEIPIFLISPIFTEVDDLPHRSLCKTQPTALKNGSFCHPPTLTATAAGVEACSVDAAVTVPAPCQRR